MMYALLLQSVMGYNNLQSGRHKLSIDSQLTFETLKPLW